MKQTKKKHLICSNATMAQQILKFVDFTKT